MARTINGVPVLRAGTRSDRPTGRFTMPNMYSPHFADCHLFPGRYPPLRNTFPRAVSFLSPISNSNGGNHQPRNPTPWESEGHRVALKLTFPSYSGTVVLPRRIRTRPPRGMRKDEATREGKTSSWRCEWRARTGQVNKKRAESRGREAGAKDGEGGRSIMWLIVESLPGLDLQQRPKDQFTWTMSTNNGHRCRALYERYQRIRRLSRRSRENLIISTI